MNMLDLLLPATADIACQDELHRLRWERGELTALDHDDVAGELALAALGGGPIRCAELVTAWQEAQEDLRVLVLASRGAADPLNPLSPEVPSVMPVPGMPPSGAGWFGSYGPMTSGPLRSRSVRGGTTRGRPVRAVARGMGARTFNFSSSGMPMHDEPREDPLLQLMRLPGGLPDRLVAMVISRWVDRFAGGSVPASASAALSVALTSRARLAVQTWLGSSGVEVEVELLAPGDSRYLERRESDSGETIAVGLPFSWLSEVWLPGLTHLLGHFTLAAEYVDDAVLLDTADTAMSRRTLTVSGHGEGLGANASA